MDHMKWHKYSSIVILVSALICIYSGHKMVRQKNGKIDKNNFTRSGGN